MHFGLFGSVDRFEPTKCIFCYRLPTEQKLWTDSNRHTPSEAFQKSFPFKNYLQSHRCNGILDRFGLVKALPDGGRWHADRLTDEELV